MRKRKTAIIIGCGRLGSMLAGDLSSRGCGVTVIDKSPRAFDRLDDRFEVHRHGGRDACRSTQIMRNNERQYCRCLHRQ